MLEVVFKNFFRGNGYPKYRSKEFKFKENGYVQDIDLNKIEI